MVTHEDFSLHFNKRKIPQIFLGSLRKSIIINICDQLASVLSYPTQGPRCSQNLYVRGRRISRTIWKSHCLNSLQDHCSFIVFEFAVISTLNQPRPSRQMLDLIIKDVMSVCADFRRISAYPDEVPRSQTSSMRMMRPSSTSIKMSSMSSSLVGSAPES